MNPSGRLPFSYPRATNNVPYQYWSVCFLPDSLLITSPPTPCVLSCDFLLNRLLLWRTRRHPRSLSGTEQQWPFGFGLSYTVFGYAVKLSSARVAIDSDFALRVTVEVNNTGARAGKEAVLLFLAADYRSLPPEDKRLARFEKIALAIGEKRVLSFTLTQSDFEFVDTDLVRRVEPSFYTLTVGGATARFELAEGLLLLCSPLLCSAFDAIAIVAENAAKSGVAFGLVMAILISFGTTVATAVLVLHWWQKRQEQLNGGGGGSPRGGQHSASGLGGIGAASNLPRRAIAAEHDDAAHDERHSLVASAHSDT